MSDLQALLDQIQRLDQEATSSPWGVAHNDYYEVGPLENDGGEIAMLYEIAVLVDRPDAEFIALARTALPAMSKALQAVLKASDEMDAVFNEPAGDWIRQAITDAMEDQ